MAIVRNPILPGFHPDPSILRHGDWYYIATSTFEWWPGVQINRSRDLARWELAGYAITRRSQLDLRGVPDSGGVWAPALSFADGQFWLAFSDMKNFAGPFKDVRNYVITAPSVDGPWSDPVFLNSSGFDPSIFHDDDGRTWVLSQLWGPITDDTTFAGIVLQEYSPTAQRLIGEPRLIFKGSALGITEGPHLYRRDGYYYLVTAEGGTSWEHAVTVARSRQLFGPYEVSPYHPLLSSASDRQHPLQKAGHGSFVQASDGRWYMAHLCSRPVPGTHRCTLGRETALQAIDWPAGDWPRLATHRTLPETELDIPQAAEQAAYFDRFCDDFDGAALSPHWNTLREPPAPTWLKWGERNGYLRIIGRHSICSLSDHSLLGLRIAHHRCRIETQMEYHPRTTRQRAGLVIYYSTTNFYYLYVSADDAGPFVNVLICDNGRCRDRRREAVRLPADRPLRLAAHLDNANLTFTCSIADGAPQRIGPVFDATTLSDDYPLETGAGWAFTGVFAALSAQDSTARPIPADFDWFHYEALGAVPASEDTRATNQATAPKAMSP